MDMLLVQWNQRVDSGVGIIPPEGVYVTGIMVAKSRESTQSRYNTTWGVYDAGIMVAKSQGVDSEPV